MPEPILRLEGTVTDVRKQVIPRMLVTTLETEDGSSVEFDTHTDLIVYRVGERLVFELYRDIPDYKEGEDFVGRATVASVREEGGKLRVLLSVGGLLFMLTLNKEGMPTIKPTEKLYVKISRK